MRRLAASVNGEEQSPLRWLSAAAPTITRVARRLALALLLLLAIIFLTYLGLDMADGTPLGEGVRNAVPETTAYLGRLAQGDLGLTTAGSNTLHPLPVTQVIAERLPRSLALLGLALLLSALVGVILGLIAARSSSEGTSLTIFLTSLVGISIPSFFAAFLLQWLVIAVSRRTGEQLLPAGGFGWDAHLVLPALVLAGRPLAQITRITFISMRDTLDQDYVRTAHAKGLRRSTVTLIHALKNAAIPILTTIGVSLRFSLSSLPVVELFFGWPGVGFTLLKGIAQQDENLSVALALCFALLFVLVQGVLELSYRLLDPRMRDPARPAQRLDSRRLPDRVRDLVSEARDLLLHNRLAEAWRERGRTLDEQIGSLPESGRRGQEETELPAAPGSWPRVLANGPLLVGGLLLLGLLAAAFFWPELAPHNPYDIRRLVIVEGEMQVPPFPPGEQYPWGTDLLGRDLLSLILAGAQLTLTLALLAVGARLATGLVLGVLAGWFSGSWLDRVILGAAQIVASFPTLLLAVLLILAVGIRQGLSAFVIALCFVGWGEIMQFVRGEVMRIRPQPYIESAVAVGARITGIFMRHLLPNLLAPLISLAALEMGAVLMLLGELGFISIFIGGGTFVHLQAFGDLYHYSDVPEWGALLSDIRYQVRSYPWTALYPMLAFFVAITSFNLFGEGLRRLVEQGRLLGIRLFNRYTIVGTLVLVAIFSWLQANTGAAAFYRQEARLFDGQRALQGAEALADPALQGRSLGTAGMEQAADRIAATFEDLGLQPGGEENGYFQTRQHTYERLLDLPTLTLEDGGEAPVYREAFAPYARRNVTTGDARAAVEAILLGRPAEGSTIGHISYPQLGRMDVEDSILLVLSPFAADRATFVPKQGLLVVAEEETVRREATLGGLTVEGLGFGSRDPTAPAFAITEEVADRLLAPAGLTTDALREQEEQLPVEEVSRIPLEVEAGIHIDGEAQTEAVRHVLGLWPGRSGYDYCTDCLGRELIVVAAQYDSPPPAPDGSTDQAANDNASGVTLMLEALRVLHEIEFQPLRSLLFVAYSGEGLDGGEWTSTPNVNRWLQAKTGFNNFEVAAIIDVGAVGAGSGERLLVAGSGSQRVAALVEEAAGYVDAPARRADDALDVGVIYEAGSRAAEAPPGPLVRLAWEGWEAAAFTPDTPAQLSAQKLEEAGETLTLTLMLLGRERNY